MRPYSFTEVMKKHPALDGNYEPNITGFQYDKDSGAYTVNFTETDAYRYNGCSLYTGIP